MGLACLAGQVLDLRVGLGLLCLGLFQTLACGNAQVVDRGLDGLVLRVHLCLQPAHRRVVLAAGHAHALVVVDGLVVCLYKVLRAAVADGHVGGDDLSQVVRVVYVVLGEADEVILGLQGVDLLGIADAHLL